MPVKHPPDCVIWWLRRDLRLAENPALAAALQQEKPLLPLFILDETLLKRSAPARTAFLFAALRSLDSDLRARGSRLVMLRGTPVTVLHNLCQRLSVEAIYAGRDSSPYARRRDEAVLQIPLPLRLLHDINIRPPQQVLKADGTPYTVFTPYSRKWLSLPQPLSPETPPPQRFPPTPSLESLPLPESQAPALFPPSEAAARARLDTFLQQDIERYHLLRDRLDQESTSLLSPYFRFGLLSAGRAYSLAQHNLEQAAGEEARRGPQSWINELLWREFYSAILYHFPDVLQHAFRATLRNIPWRNAPADLQAWQQGMSGFPVVDAAMRQLNHSGWMHNRGRMISASFLVKDLLIDWQEGERWFMQQLIDGDPAANNGGWQWTAGVGTDAAPYFRIFNPIRQGQKFDPEGRYVRRWVPELADVPLKYIHEPWRMPAALQRDCGCRIGDDYPQPLVDRSRARERTLQAYRAGNR